MSHSHDKKQCVNLAERLSEYLDGELPEDLRHQVQEHFDDCTDCERFLESLSRVRGLGTLLPAQDISPERLRELAAEVRGKISPDS